jgi:lipopolysaccharide biosynthesis glycosyltransferase
VNRSPRYPFINIVSLLDDSSVYSTLVKVFSIIKSTSEPKQLRFYFLLFENAGSRRNSSTAQATDFDKVFPLLFPAIFYEIKQWKDFSFPLSNYLKKEKFETEIIFARFYLPKIYSTLDKFIYLDNDLVVTCDLRELTNYPMTSRQPELLSANRQKKTEVDPVGRGRPSTSSVFSKDDLGSSKSSRKRNSGSNFDRPKNDRFSGRLLSRTQPRLERPVSSSLLPAAFAMVFEMHSFYSSYLSAHFNQSHPLYLQTQKNIQELYPISILSSMNSGSSSSSRQDKPGPASRYAFFLNGGVILYDTQQWNRLQFTEKAEEIIRRNAVEQVYSTSIGDQAVFYLLAFASFPVNNRPSSELLSPSFAFLPAQYNMRRLPKKTIHMLEDNYLGEKMLFVLLFRVI